MTTEPNDWWVAPAIRNSDLSTPPTLDEKITVFRSQVLDWQLNIARELLRNTKHSGFAALSIVLSYFEAMGKAKQGEPKDSRGSSGPYFKAGLSDMLADEHPLTETQSMMADFYERVRCGLYHIGMTKDAVFLSAEPKTTIFYDTVTRTLTLNPHLLVAKMIDHFNAYIRRLLDHSNTSDRQKFERYFS